MFQEPLMLVRLVCRNQGLKYLQHLTTQGLIANNTIRKLARELILPEVSSELLSVMCYPCVFWNEIPNPTEIRVKKG